MSTAGAQVVPVSSAGPVATTTVGTLAEFLQDPLTGLGSLLSLRRDLELVIDHYQPFGTRPALFLIDIDGFGRLNEVHGRANGDRILRATADRLRTFLPAGDSAYRTGGDEFVAVLRSTPMIEGVAVAGHLLDVLSRPVALDGVEVGLTVSVAVVMLGHRHRVDALLRDADVTMYRAKAEGGHRVDLYNWEVDSWATTRRRDVERLERDVEALRQQNRLLTEALTLDLYTGLPNGIAFEADHHQVEAWRRRSGDPYSILRVHVDGTSEGSGAFNGPGGAEAIRTVAHSVRDTIRQSDRAYMLGGGDLVVLLRGAVLKQAVAAADRVLSGVRRTQVAHPGGTSRYVSVTVAAIEAGFRHHTTDDILREVEGLLRHAVEAGGDRITWPH
jgi:diguanylate cyclase (GGDEF)-like protein